MVARDCIHSNCQDNERMPVLLTREEEFETWLRGSTEEALALAREYPQDSMRIVQEGHGPGPRKASRGTAANASSSRASLSLTQARTCLA
jgi:putative SOS response-associated peptidase YedK